jgi:hypothetical protein
MYQKKLGTIKTLPPPTPSTNTELVETTVPVLHKKNNMSDDGCVNLRNDDAVRNDDAALIPAAHMPKHNYN